MIQKETGAKCKLLFYCLNQYKSPTVMDWKGSRVNVFDLIGESYRQTATINKVYIDPCRLDLKLYPYKSWLNQKFITDYEF